MCLHILSLHKLYFYHKSMHFLLVYLSVYIYLNLYRGANENFTAYRHPLCTFLKYLIISILSTKVCNILLKWSIPYKKSCHKTFSPAHYYSHRFPVALYPHSSFKSELCNFLALIYSKQMPPNGQ